MFLIRNKALSWGVRHSRDIFKSTQLRKAAPKQPQTAPQQTKHESQPATAQSSGFPYKFGGISKYPNDNPLIMELLPKQTPSFSTPYRELLQAIEKKNEPFLKKLVEPSMLLPLLNKNVQTTYFNGGDGRVLTHQVDMAIGAFFKRDKSMKFKKMGESRPEIGLYVPQDLNPSTLMSSGGLPILISVHTTIIAKSILIPQGVQSPEGKEEAHSVTFEYESVFSMQDMMKMMPVMQSMMGGGGRNVDLMKSFIFKDGSSWRIGNIDHFLPSRWK